MPGCPEPSDCGSELEYPVGPGGLNKIKGHTESIVKYADFYDILWL